jgi:hypothetical protein
MTLFKGLTTGLCVAVLCLIVAPKSSADERDHKTIVTFSGPVEVPGVGQHILPAGTYIFVLLDSPSDRHIVQILSQDGTHVFTTILAIPNLRLKTTDKTVMTFRERPAGDPEALKAWFFPGHEWGEQFVYERHRAIELAKVNSEVILSTPVVLESSTVEVLTAAPVEAVTPAGETVETATVVEAPPAPAPAPQPELIASLPKTASYLSLIGLVGLVTLGGGFVLTGFLKHNV